MMPDSLRSRLISGTVSTTGGNISTLVLGMATMVLAARQLPEAAFGSYALLLVVVAFLTQVSSFGLELSVARLMGLSDDPESERRLVNTAALFRAGIILLVSVVAVLGSSALAYLFGAPLPADLVAFIPVLFFFDSMRSLFKSVLQGRLLFHRAAVAAFVASIANFLLVLLFLLVMDMGLAALLYARALSTAVALAFLMLASPIPRRIEFHIPSLRELLKFGAPLQVNDILNFLFSRLDTIVIAAFLGPADIAYYEIARKIPDSIAQLYESFRTVYYPVMARFITTEGPGRAAKLVDNTNRLVSFGALLGLLAVVLFGEQVITLLFSDKYLPSVPAFMILTGALCVSLVGSILGTSLVAAGDSGKPAMINVAHTAVSLVANLTLIPMVGIIGAAVASLGGSLATNPLNVFFLRRRGVPVRVREYLKPLAIFGGCMVLVLEFHPEGVLAKSAILLVYIVASVLLSVVTRDDLGMLLGGFKRADMKQVTTSTSGSTRV